MLLAEQLRTAVGNSVAGLDAVAEETGIDRDLLVNFVDNGRDIPLSIAEQIAGCLGVELTRCNRRVRDEWEESRAAQAVRGEVADGPRILRFAGGRSPKRRRTHVD